MVDNINNFSDFLLDIQNINEDSIEFLNINLSGVLAEFIYIPKENRLAHALSSHVTLQTIDLDLDNKCWFFEIIIDINKEKYIQIKIHYIDDDIKDLNDINKYMAIFQMCFNGDMEHKDNIDNIGILTGVSVWRCAYCYGMFGLTYDDCLLHEDACAKNPRNYIKE